MSLTPRTGFSLCRLAMIEFALWMSPVWEKGNSDDEESAAAAVDAFLRGEDRE